MGKLFKLRVTKKDPCPACKREYPDEADVLDKDHKVVGTGVRQFENSWLLHTPDYRGYVKEDSVEYVE